MPDYPATDYITKQLVQVHRAEELGPRSATGYNYGSNSYKCTEQKTVTRLNHVPDGRSNSYKCTEQKTNAGMQPQSQGRSNSYKCTEQKIFQIFQLHTGT